MPLERRLASLRFRRRDAGAVVEHGPADRVCPSCGSRNKAWRRYCADCETDLEPRSVEVEDEVPARARLESAMQRSRDAVARRSAARSAAEEAKAERKRAKTKARIAIGAKPALAAEGLAIAFANPVNRVVVLLCGATLIFGVAYYNIASKRHAPPPSRFELQAGAPVIPPPTSPALPPSPQLAGGPSALPPLPGAADGGAERVQAGLAAPPSQPRAVRRRRRVELETYCTRGGRACIRRVRARDLY